MNDLEQILSIWDGKSELSVGSTSATPSRGLNLSVYSPKPMIFIYEFVGGNISDFEIIHIPQFPLQHKLYGAGCDARGTIYAIYAGPWKFPFALYVGMDTLYRVDADFILTKRKNGFKIKTLFTYDKVPRKISLNMPDFSAGKNTDMKLSTCAGRDVEQLANMVQTSANIYDPSEYSGDECGGRHL